MNNVIQIFVDSVTFEAVGTTRASVSPTPFLDALKKESITASKLYSHGPYTDAAKTSLHTGRNCLDDFGYYFRENSSPITDFKLFHDAGYETYCFSYPFWLYGKTIRDHIDHLVYTAGFVFGSEWGGMFSYYYELAKQRELKPIEYKLLSSRFDLFFQVYIDYFNDLINNQEAGALYKECLGELDLNHSLELLSNEYNNFKENQRAYIDGFNSLGLEHVLATLDYSRVDSIISRSFHESIYDENIKFFKRIRRNNIKANIWSSCPSFKRVLWGLSRYFKTKNKNELIFVVNYFLGLFPFDLMRKRWGTAYWQNDRSIHSILNSGIEFIENHIAHSQRPFYMYLNTDDPHNNIAMFAYDTQDRDVVNDEIRVLNEFVAELGTNFKGSLLYFLSLRYVDYEIEKFCARLKQMGIWDKTTMLVLSDHGSSYTFNPLHNSRVNCFDDECYHIPLLLRHPGLKGVEINTYQNSKDILPTVCDMIGIPKSSLFKGYSMLDKSRPISDYVITEYMGPGCPDMTSRRMWLSIRDNKYIVAYKVGVYEQFEDGELAEVYDLNKDPNGFYNISHQIDKEEIQYLLIPLRRRYEEIKEDVFYFLRHNYNE